MSLRSGLAALLLGLLVFVPSVVADEQLPEKTALDEYVHAPDDVYAWSVAKTVEGENATTFVLDLTSQRWRTEDEVDRTVWKHWLVVVVPKELKHDKAMLFIGGGSNESGPPDNIASQIRDMATLTGSVVAELKMVPNQPLVFFNDGKKRTEDDLVAYTWDKFLTTGDPTWPARNPMVKSAVRAMDAITEFMASDEGGQHEINGFVVAGGSKRGWTTWLTGAVDDRVVAIVPIVIDVVNTYPSMTHHHDAYGFWAPAVWDYTRHKIMERAETPEYQDLLRLVDPWYYRHRLEKPKLILNAAGDQFFLPDSSKFYFDGLLGEKHLRYVPNTGHSLSDSDGPATVLAFYNAILNEIPRPEFSWEFPDENTIVVTPEQKPKEVNLWQATNPNSRDFRIDALGPKYTSTTLEPQADGTYIGKVSEPQRGFTAFFVEMVYDSGTVVPFKFTTPVRVTPDVLPHKGKWLKHLEKLEQEKSKNREAEPVGAAG